jgi:Amt family ammonium transporter
VNPAGADGLLAGNPGQLWTQLVATAAAWVLALVGTFVILRLIKLFTPLRVEGEDEITGLDLSLHGEVAYNFVSGGFAGGGPTQRR